MFNNRKDLKSTNYSTVPLSGKKIHPINGLYLIISVTFQRPVRLKFITEIVQ